MTPTAARPRPVPRPFRRRAVALVGALALLSLGTVGPATTADATPVQPSAPVRPSAPVVAAKTPDLGPNVTLITPAMAQADVQAKLDAIAARQVSNQFGEERDAVLFAPGTYGSVDAPLIFQVGYYTEVAGLGRNPSDVVINGSVDVYNQCDADGCLALNNFWRSMSNLTIHAAGGTGCQLNTEFWAVSQAAPLRRVDISGRTSFMDYCTAGPQYASGGFLADSRLGSATNGSQQQWLTRNSQLGSWSNGVWNQAFSGVLGAPPQSFSTLPTKKDPYTTLARTPASKEKPYLYIDRRGDWQVFVPRALKNSSGPSWADGSTRGKSLPLSSFYLARPADSAKKIDRRLAQGRNVLFTPGVYGIDRTLHVRKAGTVVLGLGLATLTAERGAVPLKVADVAGVDVAGLTIDAGTKNSSALLVVGAEKGHRKGSSAANPTAVQDVFFRIGGPHVGKASTSLVVNSDHVILDDIWAWRADHGVKGSVGWTTNTAATGVKITGDHVTATGLFVEHYQRYNVVWTGEHGRTVFFQNELPYDAPDQAAWRHGTTLGWAAYKVGAHVRHHELWAGGSYIYTNVDPTLHLSHAFEVPDRKGVRLHDLVTVSLNKAGTIDHVVNDVGDPALPDPTANRVNLVTYP